MGIFKKAKKFVSKQVKSAIDHPLATAVGLGLSAAIGPSGMALTGLAGSAAVGQAASTLLSGGLKRKKPGSPDDVDLLASPFAGVTPMTKDVPLRMQQEGQRATGGGVATAEGSSDLLEEDEIKKRRASRMLLG